ncbi:hypothetical protein PoB_006043000 [Plakobranchus ocellatus]|uniref:Uncharacterized protein n=1 Tax=Plakobranchus ocellatus TaxID=259542 RepID=A0AAV4CPX7_9GAST|nr:hypothetical protein PoB_006043000 [Plakobranchus ocellatus]
MYQKNVTDGYVIQATPNIFSTCPALTTFTKKLTIDILTVIVTRSPAIQFSPRMSLYHPPLLWLTTNTDPTTYRYDGVNIYVVHNLPFHYCSRLAAFRTRLVITSDFVG